MPQGALGARVEASGLLALRARARSCGARAFRARGAMGGAQSSRRGGEAALSAAERRRQGEDAAELLGRALARGCGGDGVGGRAAALDAFAAALGDDEREVVLGALARRRLALDGREQKRDAPAHVHEEFTTADANADGVLTREEWVAFRAAQEAASNAEVSAAQLVMHAARGAGSMVGFGFSDNFVMLLAGEAIEAQLGPRFGLYGLAAAAAGNLVADVVGCLTSGTVERISEAVLPDPGLSLQQEAQPAARAADTIGQVVGISAGCVLGCVPLLFGVGTTAEEVGTVGTVGAARASKRALRRARLGVRHGAGATAQRAARGRVALAQMAAALQERAPRAPVRLGVRAPTFGAHVLLVASVAMAARRLVQRRREGDERVQMTQ